MEENNTPLSALSESIESNIIYIRKTEEERLLSGNARLLEDMVNRMTDMSQEINTTIATVKSWQKAVRNMVAEAICKVADGNIAVPRYMPKAKAEQEMFLYDGTYWSILDMQEQFDCMKDCCAKCGLPQEQLNDANFMETLFHQVAFMVARKRDTITSKEKVFINMANGTLEINEDAAEVFRPHCREDFFTYKLDYAYDPAATCPLWLEFLDRMLPEAEAQQILAEFIGYCFTQGIKAEKMLVLYGSGSNGKSVVLDVVEALFGRKNVSNVSLADLTINDEKRCAIEYKLVNISHESDKEIDAATMKLMVSGEPIDCRQLYFGTHTMYRYAKFITSFNILPRAESTHGFYRRFIIMPFNVTISEKEADVDLAKKIIKAELPGILNWVLESMKGFLRTRTFTRSEMCTKALERYKLQSDSVRLFMSEMCEADSVMLTPGPELYNAYKRYCMSDQLRPVGKQKFYERATALGYTCTEIRSKKSFYIKIIDNG